MIDYANALVQHYKDVRARLDGRAPPRPAIVVAQPEPEPEPPAPPPPPPPPPPDPLPGVTCSPDTKRAIATVLDRLGMTWAQANARSNAHIHANARAEIYVLLRERGWSYPRIGALMGGRDHTTIMTSVQRYHARKVTK
jgi:hypothetical protein